MNLVLVLVCCTPQKTAPGLAWRKGRMVEFHHPLTFEKSGEENDGTTTVGPTAYRYTNYES